jgi:hypothetical protein
LASLVARRGFFDDRFASAWLAVAMAVAAVTILWLSRGTTFWIDELVLFMDAPRLDAGGAFDPHVGHLVLTVRVVYKAIFEVFGASYLPFRLLGVATLLLTVGLLFAYLRRRVPPFVALAPCLVLLVFGSDTLHVLTGNAFGVLLAVSCGLGALLALEREDRVGDIAASALLCLGVFTYTVALAFLAGAAVLVLLQRNRWRRAWIVVIPLALYGAWFVWAATSASGPDNEATFSNVFLLPAWAVQSLGAALGAVSGFDYAFPGSSSDVGLGPSLGVLALVGAGIRLGRGSAPAGLWAALAVLAALWGLGVLAADGGNRAPDAPRYLFPGTVVVLMAAAGCLAGRRWTMRELVGLYALAVCGVSVNLFLLQDEGKMLRSAYAVQVKAAFAAVDIAGDSSRRDFDPPPVPGGQGVVEEGQSPLKFPFGLTSMFERTPVTAYQEAAERYAALGYSLEEIRASSDSVRTQTDSVLVAALGLRLRRPPASPTPGPCRQLRASGPTTVARIPPGGALLRSSEEGSISVRRFARESWIPLGPLAQRAPALLAVPPDSAPDPWWLASSAGSLRVCALR